MGRAISSREVLIAEALGDFVELLDRIDGVTPMLENSCSQLEATADRLLGNIEIFQKRIVENALDTQNRAVAHIAEQANLVMRKAAVEQIAAMQESARQIFKDEVGPPLVRVAGQLREANLRKPPWREVWLTHAAVAVGTASCTFALMAYVGSTSAAVTPRPVTSVPPAGFAGPAQPPSKARDRR